MTSKRLLSLLFAAYAGSLASTVWAEAEYPTKPITIVVPFVPGGSSDVIARTVGNALSLAMKQSVVIDNRSGAAGQVGAAVVAKAPPDGYTLLLAVDNIYSINNVLYGKPAQEILKKLVPITNMAEGPLVIAVSSAFPANNLAELLAYAKSKDVPLSFGTSGIGTPHHLAGEMLARMTGIKLNHIPYRGTSLAVVDLIGGQLDMMFGLSASLQPLATSGKVKFLAETMPTTFPLLPTLPPVADTVKGYSMALNLGMMAPAGTPPAIIEKLSKQIGSALANDREVRAKIYEAGMVPKAGGPVEYAKQIEREAFARAKLITEAGITPQ